MEPLSWSVEVLEIDGGRKAYVYTFDGTSEEADVLNSSEDDQ